MSEPQAVPPRPLPGWLLLAGSAALGLHLFAVLILALAAPSGPWPTDFGRSMSLEPQFAGAINGLTTRYYLQPLGMTHNYHFVANHTAAPDVYFEVRLSDKSGRTLKTVRFPERDANFWVRHRQHLLAQRLADDQPYQPIIQNMNKVYPKDTP